MAADDAHFEKVNMAGATFTDVDLSAAVFRDVNLSKAMLRGIFISDAEIDGEILSLRINGVDVMPLVEAERDRQQPERKLLRSTTADGVRQAWSFIESTWAGTMRHAETLVPADLEWSVNGEWSFTQTLRHLILATDVWLGNALFNEDKPFHAIGLPFTSEIDPQEYGIDVLETVPFAEVVRVRAGRMAKVRSFVDSVTDEELHRMREPGRQRGWPPPKARTALDCLRVIFNEELEHHRFAVRDLDIIKDQTRT